MLIVPTLRPEGELYLDAYTYDDEDFSKIAEEIRAAGLHPEAHDMENPGKRNNKRFIIAPVDVPKLEYYMQAKFQRDGARHFVEFDNEGDVYEVHALNEEGDEVHTIKILAKNERFAEIKAGLMANNNKWHDAAVAMVEQRK